MPLFIGTLPFHSSVLVNLLSRACSRPGVGLLIVHHLLPLFLIVLRLAAPTRERSHTPLLHIKITPARFYTCSCPVALAWMCKPTCPCHWALVHRPSPTSSNLQPLIHEHLFRAPRCSKFPSAPLTTSHIHCITSSTFNSSVIPFSFALVCSISRRPCLEVYTHGLIHNFVCTPAVLIFEFVFPAPLHWPLSLNLSLPPSSTIPIQPLQLLLHHYLCHRLR